jgi:hypothetical protein
MDNVAVLPKTTRVGGKVKTATTKAPKATRKTKAKIAKRPIAMRPMVAMTGALLLVSLPHQADGLMALTSMPGWQAWSMALAVDGLTMATEFAEMTATNKPEIKHGCHGLLGMTLALSWYLNSTAMGGSLENWPNILIAGFIPAAIAFSTWVISKIR